MLVLFWGDSDQFLQGGVGQKKRQLYLGR